MRRRIIYLIESFVSEHVRSPLQFSIDDDPINSSLRSVSSISPKIVTRVFEYLATYLQRYSASGLIDTFDLERVVKSALRSLGDYKSEAEKELIANVFKEDGNCTIAVARGLDAYGFSHRLFQEYFVAMTLVRMTETTMTPLCAKIIANRLLGYGMHSNYRQPILLAVGWLSFHLSAEQFDVICTELVSRKYSGMPIGTLLLLEAITMMYQPLTIGILIAIFDTLFAVEYGGNFDRYVLRALDAMNENVVMESVTEYIKLKGRAERFCLFLNRACKMTTYSELYASSDLLWFSPSICQALWTSQFNTIQEQTNLDLALWITSMSTMYIYIGKIKSQLDLQNFLIEHNIQCDQIHPLILSLIIALNGGLDLLECGDDDDDDDVSILFSPYLMHRPSDNAIAQKIITYFSDDTSDPNTKINHLIEYCEQTIRNTISTDTSSSTIDLFITLICLHGVHKPNIFQEFYHYPALALSLTRFKQILIHFRQLYGDTDKSTFSKASESLNEIVVQSQTDVSLFIEAVSTALTRLTTRDRPASQKYLRVPLEKYCSRTIPLFCPDVYDPTNEKEEASMIDQSRFIEKSDEWRGTLENILRNDRLLCTHRAVAQLLVLHKKDRHIIVNFINEYMSNSELHKHTLISCLEALYSQPGDQDELNQIDAALHNLLQSTSSSVSQTSLALHAHACYLHYQYPIGTHVQKLLIGLNLDVPTLYKIIMLNERAHLWANRLLRIYSSQLKSQFIVDLFDILSGKTNDKCVAVFLLAAQWMAKNDPEKFCDDVRTNRDLIESLFPYLKQTSIRRRYLIAYLLIHIASIDLISFVEVYELLGEMINDSESQQTFVGQDGKRHTLSEEIRYLLLEHSCIEIIEQDNTPLVSWITAEADYLKALDDSRLVSCVVSDS
ncbi:unnamed protein product [Rotaria sordida]|uniref:Uncharacterized protein n=1 Tax=Rotaria sordida TaxID=392033 RepID=A0A814Q765_9BILA|nr:unnamed protein product [Rotaria sordida]